MGNVPTILKKLKTNVDNLEFTELRTVPIDFEKLREVIDKKMLKKKQYKAN